MAISITDNSASISTTEYFLVSNSTTATYQTTDAVVQVFLDLNAMAAGDEYLVKAYEKVPSTARVFYQARLIGAQSELWVSPAFTLGNGWEWSLTKVAGTDRTIPWSIRQIS